MSVKSRLRSWWKAIVHRSRTEDEVEAELSFHLDAYADDLVRAGVSREEAMRRARLELGAPVRQREEYRVSLGLTLWDDLLADVRYAARQLWVSPAFTATVLLVLTLGIGANTAMFSVIDATLLRRLPYERSSQLVSLSVLNRTGQPGLMFSADVLEWERQSHTLSGLAYYDSGSKVIEAAGGEESLSAIRVSPNFFSVLGVPLAMGRTFLIEEQTPGREKEVVLSDGVWRSLFSADPTILGKQVKLDDEPYTVVGIAGRHFFFPANDPKPQVWLPATMTAATQKREFGSDLYQVIARVRDGDSIVTAAAELNAIQKNLVLLYSSMVAPFAPVTVIATPYRDTLVQEARPALQALATAVVIIWLIACANVANLLLARGVAREREIAVRGALGADRSRIVRQLFTESLLLSVAGSIGGLALSQLALYTFNKALTTRLNLTERLVPNPAVLTALLALSGLSALLFGLFPAWLAARAPMEQSLLQNSQQAGQGRGRRRLQQSLVIAEVSLSLVLLVGCGLTLRTMFALRRVPLGFRTDHVLFIQPTVRAYKHRGVDVTQTIYRRLLERVQHMSGVEAASLTTIVPLRKTFESKITMYTDRGGASGKIEAKLMAVGPELQDVLGFRMFQGRFFNQSDTVDSAPVVVVNRAFADQYAADGQVIGHLKLGSRTRQAEVVGVMDDFHQTSIDQPSVPEIDFCTTQLRPDDGFYQPTMQAHIELAVRTATDPAALIPDLQRVMTQVSPDLQASATETMDQVVEDSLGDQLLAARLLELFAGSALVIALAGLYGLLMYLVTQRTKDLGVRIALGAQRHHIIAMLLLEGGRLLLIGALIGVALAYLATRLLATFLYGVGPHDAVTMIAVTFLLMSCGLLAAYIPARKASRVDPMKALRVE